MLLIAQVGVVYGADANMSPSVKLKDGVPVLILPDSLSRFIIQQYPKLRLPARSDMTGSWARFIENAAVPYACWGFFDDKEKTDIALILLGKGEWRVLAFHPLNDGQYAVLPLEGYPGSTEDFTKAHVPQEFSLFTVKAGQSLVIGGKEIPDTKHPHDAVAFFSVTDLQTGILYQWMPPEKHPKEGFRYGDYIASVFGALSD
jgi:hypothetical protein